jgi:V/A-type H+-transporting ATPase subunit E
MNGIEKLTQQINADAQAEIDAVLAEAQSKADGITAEYAQRAEKTAAEILSKGEVAAAQREERLVSMSDMEKRKSLLGVKQEMLSKAFDLALEKLCALPDEEYTAMLVKLAVKASKTGREQLIFSQKDRSRVGKAVVTAANEALPKGALTLSEQTRPIRGGFILSDGAVEVNCAFETLVRLQRGEISGDVAGVLFA